MTQTRPYPLYTSHKQVRAAQIDRIEDRVGEFAGGAILVMTDPALLPYTASREWMQRFRPKPGGYVVVYEDGYTSWSPRAAFEAGYTRAEVV